MNVLVIGDKWLDVFIYGDIHRISPEAPVPIFVPTHETKNEGMSKNVVNNVESLEMTVYSLTNETSIVKKRYVDSRSNQMVLRVDEHDYCDRIDKKILSGIVDNSFTPIFGHKTKLDAIIISDYCKGFLEEEDIQFICENNKYAIYSHQKDRMAQDHSAG